MLGKSTAVLIAAGTLLGFAVPGHAAAPPIIASVSMTMLADDVVHGVDIPKARISVTPPVEGAAVQVQRLQTVKGVRGWRVGGTVSTHAGGLVTVRFNLAGPGAFSWRAVVTRPNGTRVASPARVVTVHPATSTAGDTVGPDLLALEYALCIRVSDALAAAASREDEDADPSPGNGQPAAPSPPSGGGVPAGSPSRYLYPAANCAGRPFAAAIWAAFTSALATSTADTPLEMGPEVVWRPVLLEVLKRTRADARRLGPGAKRLFADLLAKDRAKAADAYAECVRDVGDAPRRAARTRECLWRARAADWAVAKAQL